MRRLATLSRSLSTFASLAVLACSAPDPAASPEALAREIRAEFPDIETLTTAELADWLADPARPAPVLLDARAPEEYAVSHLPGAVLAPTAEAAQRALEAEEPGRPVVAYCSVGYRSARLARSLEAAGRADVRNLEGSIFAWAREGRPLVRGGREVREVHPYDARWGAHLPRELWSGEPAGGTR